MEKENHGSLAPICVLKVDLHCCKACAHILKKQLKQINGVTSIHINTKKGLVTVSGVTDVSILMKAVKRIGRKAELCKFEMQPKNQHDLKPKETHCNHSDSDSNSEDGGYVHANNHFNGHGAVGSSGTVPYYHHNPNIAMHGPPPAAYYPAGLLPPYPPSRPYGYGGAPPMVYGRPPPPAYNYYPPHPLQRPSTYPGGPSSVAHTFSDLNANGCTII